MGVNGEELAMELRKSVVPLRRTCRRLARRAEDADDLMQEALLRALVAAPRLDRPLAPWLARVARNVHVDTRRRAARFVHVDLGDTPAPAPVAQERWPADGARLLVVHLGPRELAVLLLREALDVPVADTAAALRLSAANVRVIHHRAMQRLRSRPPVSERGAQLAVDAFVAWVGQHRVDGVGSLVEALGGQAAPLAGPCEEADRAWSWVIQAVAA